MIVKTANRENKQSISLFLPMPQPNLRATFRTNRLDYQLLFGKGARARFPSPPTPTKERKNREIHSVYSKESSKSSLQNQRHVLSNSSCRFYNPVSFWGSFRNGALLILRTTYVLLSSLNCLT